MVMPLVKTYLTIFIVVLALLCPNAFSATQTGLPIYAPILLDDFGTGELTAWRIFYTNADGNMTELELGANGTYLRSSGVDQVPGFSTPSGAGDVVGPAANTDNYVPQWDGADSKALKNGFAITDAGKALLDDANASVQLVTLGAFVEEDIDTEDKLETVLTDVTDVFTNNDGALNDDNVTLADVQAACSGDFHNIGGTDDDVPEAGDFGAATDLDANGAVAWGNITEGELADNTTIGDDIKADTIDSKHYAAGSIDDEHLASGVDAAKIGDGSISNEEYQRLDGLTEDILTSLDARCLESVFGTGISTGLLLDGTDLKVSAILQEYHGVDPTAAGLALLDDANSTVQRTTLGLGSAATRDAEDSLTNGANLPDGAAITTYVEGAFLKNDGDTGTGVYDFGGATSFEIPNSDASPSVAGQIRYDTTVAGLTNGALAYFGGDVRYLVDLDTLPSNDNYVVSYDADADKFYMKQDSEGAGGEEVNNLEDGCADIADTEIFIGTGAGTGNYAALTGDVTMTNAGVTSFANDSVDDTHINWGTGAGQVNYSDITGGDVVIGDAGNIGSASDTDAIAIAADGKVTFSQDVIVSGTGIELNHASENTLTASSGVLSIEGTALVKASSEVNSAGTIADSVTVTGWALGASTATTPDANDADTSLATTAFCETTQDYLKTSEKDDVDAIPDDDNSSEGPQTDDINAGESVTAFNVVYLHSDGEWHETDASAAATSKGMLAISLESKGDGEAMNVALSGSFVRHDTWAWTVGGDLYLSESAGEITQTAPTTTDSATRIIGHATHADRIYFNPDNIYVIHE